MLELYHRRLLLEQKEREQIGDEAFEKIHGSKTLHTEREEKLYPQGYVK